VCVCVCVLCMCCVCVVCMCYARVPARAVEGAVWAVRASRTFATVVSTATPRICII
jgi:hypothetical protein